MSNPKRPDPRSNEAIIRSLTDDPQANSMALGCAVCPDKPTCGGLCLSASLLDCLEHCCGDPSNCTRVCANNPLRYAPQMQEINGFALDNVKRAPIYQAAFADEIAPLVYHGGRRNLAAPGSIFALRVSDLVDFKRREVRFPTRQQLSQAFHINAEAQIILTGVNHDHLIEPWWMLGDARLGLIEQLKNLGITAVTTPNFSLVLDHPRTDDLHAIKRIAITFAEFQQAGIPTALHPNGRTDRDFQRWARFIAEREEISLLAYEFITGPGTVFRRRFHLDSLAKLAAAIDRPLDIVVRGDPHLIPFLREHFRRVIYIDTTAFMKTLKRQKAHRHSNSGLKWVPAPTAHGQHIDGLYAHNLHEQRQFLRATYYASAVALPKAA